MWFWTFLSLGLAGILDLAVGTLVIHLLSTVHGYPLAWWQYVIGACLGASPDIDLFLAFFRKNASAHHEYLTHRPVVGIPFAVAIGWVLGGDFWAIAAGIGVCWHYLHDTDGFLGLNGGGIAWCWPFSQKYWGVRNYRIVSQTPRADDGGGNNYEWFHKTYLSPTRRSIVEFMLTSMCAGYVAADLVSIIFGIALVGTFWCQLFFLWASYRFLTLLD